MPTLHELSDRLWRGDDRTTLELLQWWHREGREKRLFFAQLEAAETIILKGMIRWKK